MKISRRFFLGLFSAGFLGLGLKTNISFGAKPALINVNKIKLGRTGIFVTPLAFGAS